MNELERRLRELGGEIAYPATPRFELELERRPARRGVRRPLVLALAVLVVALAGVLALSPGARSAFLEIFHIRGATVELVETLPDVEAQRLDFGERVSRETAERRAGFELLDLGEEPDAIFIRPDGLVSVVYGDPDEPRLVLSQARGAIYDGFIKKVGAARHDRRARSRWTASPASSSTARTTSSCSATRTGRSPTSARTSRARCCSGTAATCSCGSRAT